MTGRQTIELTDLKGQTPTRIPRSLPPGFMRCNKGCGLAVIDPEAHDDWHARKGV